MKWLLFFYPWLELWSLIELGAQTSVATPLLRVLLLKKTPRAFALIPQRGVCQLENLVTMLPTETCCTTS